MLTLPPAVRIYVATEPIDMRKSFTGLAGAVRQRFRLDPMSGHLFVFLNKRATLLKAIFWDRTGYLIVGKRLSRGTFRLPVEDIPEDVARVEVDAARLALMLEGLDLRGARQRKRWRPTEVQPLT